MSRRVRKVSVDTPGGGVPKRVRRKSPRRNQTTQLDNDSGDNDAILIPKYNIRLRVGSTLEQAFVDENDGETKLYEGTITAIGESRGVETIQIAFIDEVVVVSVPNFIKEIENGNISLSTISNGEDMEDEEAEHVEDSNEEDASYDEDDLAIGRKVSIDTASQGKDSSIEEEEEEEDGHAEDKWDLQHILTIEEITRTEPLPQVCMTRSCLLPACTKYVQHIDQTNIWYSCLDCQEEDFGGWPEDLKEYPVNFLTKEHRKTMKDLCSDCGLITMPNIPINENGDFANDIPLCQPVSPMEDEDMGISNTRPPRRARRQSTRNSAQPEHASNENIPWIKRRRPFVCRQVGEQIHLKPCGVCDQALLKDEWIFETQHHLKIHGDAGPGCYTSYLHPQCVSQACTKFGRKEYIAACYKNFAKNCIAIVVDEKEVPLHEHNEELYDEICQILEKHFYVDANVCANLKRAFFYDESEQIDRSYVPFLHTDVEDGPINLPPNSITLEVCGEEIQFEGIAIRKRNKQEDNIFFCPKDGCCWGGIHKAKNEADVTDDSKDIYESVCSHCDEKDSNERTFICKKCNTVLYNNHTRLAHTIEKCKETQGIIPYQKMVYKCELPEDANMRSVINALITDKASPFSFLFERDTVYDQGISNQDDESDKFGFNRMSDTMGLIESHKIKMFARYTDWFEHVEGVGILFENVTPEEHINMSMMVEELAYVSFANAHHGIILSSPKAFGHGIRETRNASNAGKESFLLYFTGAKPKHNHSLKANFRKGRKGRERERELYEQKQKEEHRYQTNFIYQHIKNWVSSGGSVV